MTGRTRHRAVAACRHMPIRRWSLSLYRVESCSSLDPKYRSIARTVSGIVPLFSVARCHHCTGTLEVRSHFEDPATSESKLHPAPIETNNHCAYQRLRSLATMRPLAHDCGRKIGRDRRAHRRCCVEKARSIAKSALADHVGAPRRVMRALLRDACPMAVGCQYGRWAEKYRVERPLRMRQYRQRRLASFLFCFG